MEFAFIGEDKISRIGLGTWAFGGDYWEKQDHFQSVRTIHAALRGEINHFDTAQVYGKGRAEQVTGQQLRKVASKVFIATKSMMVDHNKVVESIKKSLGRLNLPRIDLFYIHWPKSGVDPRPMMDELIKAKEMGLIRKIGVSNFTVKDLDLVLKSGKVDCHQFGYNFFWRFPEREIVPFCLEKGIVMITYSTLAQGILTGKYPPRINRHELGMKKNFVLFRGEIWPFIYEGLNALKIQCEQTGLSMGQLVIRWTLNHPWITSILIGARNRKQLESLIPDPVLDIKPEIFKAMTQISDRIMEKIPDTGNLFDHKT